MKKKISVVGGGTAGWISALFAQRFFPESEITVIETSNIDIIGVGESTTPAIVDMFDFLGISVSELVTNCGATIKNSIKFTNWNGDKRSYYHGFDVYDPNLHFFSHSKKSMYSEYDLNWPFHKSFLAVNELFNGKNLDDIHFSSVLSRKNKVPFIFNDQKTSNQSAIYHFDRPAMFALHINARLLAAYLKTVGANREIKLIDSKVTGQNLDDKGYVASLNLENGMTIESDFVFDCTGFARIFVDKLYKSQMKSFKNFLPVKKAIPFFIENKKSTPPYTEALSMKNGWMWKIPVEGRFGCGYVFDSDYITPDQAYEEVCETIGTSPEVPKVISFEPGYFRTPWNKNVLSVGLSSGFIEPLEATSIWIITISLSFFTEHIAGFTHKDEKSISEYNEEFNKAVDSISSLVRLHYQCKRADSDFWKEFRNKNTLPDRLAKILDIYKYRLPSTLEKNLYHLFPVESWFTVSAGNQIFTRETVEKEYSSYNVNQSIGTKSVDFSIYAEQICDLCVEHDEFLKYLRANSSKTQN
jgi:tryptophan halogenase